MFNPAELAAIDLPPGATGGVLRAISNGIADSAPLPEVERLVSGEAMRPPPVCHLRAWREGQSVHLGWVRRSQRGWSWNDGVEVPPDSYPGCYRVTVTGPAGAVEFETEMPAAIFDAGSLPGEAGQTMELQIRTIGPMAMSHPRCISLTL